MSDKMLWVIFKLIKLPAMTYSSNSHMTGML
jgi:hypothetical protein